MVAVVVAVSEGILYLIWEARKDRSRRPIAISRAQKEGNPDDSREEVNVVKKTTQTTSSGLRRRQAQLTEQ